MNEIQLYFANSCYTMCLLELIITSIKTNLEHVAGSATSRETLNNKYNVAIKKLSSM